MIARTWAGATRAADADAYLDYLHATGFPEYQATPGNRGVLALRRVAGDRAGRLLVHPGLERLMLTLWESEEAIRRFAGDDIERAVFYPEDERFLIERGERVRHYEVVYVSEEVAP